MGGLSEINETEGHMNRRVWMMCGVLAGALAGAGCTGKDGLFHLGDPSPPKRAPVAGQPEFPATVVAEDPPPPISGGTLAVTKDGTAVAADPDRDRVSLMMLDSPHTVRHVWLQPHDEPGRVAVDDQGRAFVVLRRAGAVVTIDLASATVVDRRAVCAAPRGLAWAADGDVLHVACAGGELVTLRASGGPPVRALRLDPDLRDVVVDGDVLFVSRFRAAEILVVDGTGAVVARHALPDFSSMLVRSGAAFAPAVAWRMVRANNGIVQVVHQRALKDTIPTGPAPASSGGYYGADDAFLCGSGVVHSTVTAIGRSGFAGGGPVLTKAVLPVDAAVAAAGNVAVVAAGNGFGSEPALFILKTDAAIESCDSNAITRQDLRGRQAVAVAWPAGGPVVVQLRNPLSLYVLRDGVGYSFPLDGDDREDTGHQIFHANSSAGLACASCHPEGGDDGHTWQFVDVGARRTQYLRGGVLGTAPFHWSGDLGSFSDLYLEVMVNRMSGPDLLDDKVNALGRFLDRLPAVGASPAVDAAAVERGRTLFLGAAGCAACHDGALHTNNKSADVGTGGAFQVPALVDLASRTRFMHDGCAAGLADRFGACGGGDKHGRISQLAPSQLADLLSYLATL